MKYNIIQFIMMKMIMRKMEMKRRPDDEDQFIMMNLFKIINTLKLK